MKTKLFIILILIANMQAISQNTVETQSGKIKIFSTNSILSNNYSFPGTDYSGIENLVTLNYNSYYSYSKIIGLKNTATALNSFTGSIGIDNTAIGYGSVGMYSKAVGNYSKGFLANAKGTTANDNGTFTGAEGGANGDASTSTYTGIAGNATYINSTTSTGIYRGVFGYAQGGTNAYNYGIYGTIGNTGTNSFAGYFQGNVHVNGMLSKSAGTFKIDHPLDPQNKYLSHSFVESPDMMNIYNGNITTDQNGRATVSLPDYFEALNMDFRYQLTTIGGFANLTVLEEIQGNKFIIASDKPNVKVSWQVTGIRNDAYAKKNRIVPEEEKPEKEKGKYLNADAFGLPRDESIHAVKSNETFKK